jgi:catechol 2,3-dioxygenase-like lactoylglutathione lyase family enzyme
VAGAVRIRHTGIVVSDLDRAMRFYRDLLGLEIKRRMVESGPCIANILGIPDVVVETVKLGLDNDGAQIELLSFISHSVSVPEGNRALLIGPTHIALTVDNLEDLYIRMCAVGIEFNCPPQSSPDGKVSLTYCKDPDGNLIELVEVR